MGSHGKITVFAYSMALFVYLLTVMPYPPPPFTHLFLTALVQHACIDPMMGVLKIVLCRLFTPITPPPSRAFCFRFPFMVVVVQALYTVQWAEQKSWLVCQIDIALASYRLARGGGG